MKTALCTIPIRIRSIQSALAMALVVFVQPTRGQGTITFDHATGFAGTTYSESGMQFRVIMPSPGRYDEIGVSGPISGPSNIPYNSTPYMGFTRFYSADDYIILSLSSGSAFGLNSVQLADPNSPSDTALSITFRGYKAGGLTVAETFTTPGGGADHLLTYQFAADFGSGLTSVDIIAPRWAMDNLVFTVPEPSSVVLAGLGLVVLRVRVVWKRRRA